MKLLVSSSGPHAALLDWGNGARRAATGAGGIGTKLSEGDGVTPAGDFFLRRVLYRADRIARPATGLPLAQLAPDDGWCDAPLDPDYNRAVKLPHRASAERLWRDDHLYDLMAVIGFNDAPVIPSVGSAIFLHIARPDFGVTQGCVALAMNDLLEAVARLAPGDMISIRS